MKKRRLLFVGREMMDSFPRIKALMEREGFVVTSVTSRKAGLELTYKGVDAILMGLRLDHGSVKYTGLDLLETLRLRTKVPIVIVTEYASLVTAVAAMKSGATHFMTVHEAEDKPEFLGNVLKGKKIPETRDQTALSLDEVEWHYLNRMFVYCGQDIARTARALRITRITAEKRLKKNAPPEGEEHESIKNWSHLEDERLRKRVLVVSSDQQFSKRLEFFLKKEDLIVNRVLPHTALSRHVLQYEINAIVMDLGLENSAASELEAAESRLIKKIRVWSKVPIVVLNEGAGSVMAVAAIKEGDVYYISLQETEQNPRLLAAVLNGRQPSMVEAPSRAGRPRNQRSRFSRQTFGKDI